MNTPLASAEKVFVDTTIQIERFFYPFDRQTAIEHFLSSREIMVSSTSFREFQAAMVQAFEYVITAIKDLPNPYEATDVGLRLSEVPTVIAVHPGPYSIRQANRINFVISLVQSHFEGLQEIVPVDMIDYLRDEVRNFREYRFFEFGYAPNHRDVRETGGYIDPCSCPVAHTPLDPIAGESKVMTCHRARRTCGIQELLLRHRERAIDAAEAVASRKPRIPGALDSALALADQGTSSSLGQRLCWPLGDIVMSLECHDEGGQIYATDGDYVPICDALGVPLAEE